MMIFHQLIDPDSCSFTYLIADPMSRDAVLVDPVLEQVERDLNILHALGLTLRYCLETHVHADHITGAGHLRQLTECKTVVPALAEVIGVDWQIRHHDTIRLGAVEIRAIATPGHTNSHMAYGITAAPTDPIHLLTGDALFIRGCGRTDFQGGDAGALYDSVTQQLFSFPDNTRVYPGHDYKGCTVSTIGEEKQWNPRFAGRDRCSFIDLMNSLNLPQPKKISVAVPANRCCGLETENFAEPQPIACSG
jgi:glyoxylase-like metal-dependent hydrolase (beta-lactamase superfamily II)